MSFSVTYWDQLGWKDIFAHPAFTARQWEYSRAAGRGNVSTPQMIVNGRGVLVGSNKAQVADALRRHDRGASGPAITVGGNRVAIAAGKVAKPANIWLVRYDPRVQQVPIRAGENGGRTLPHKNFVRHIQLWASGMVPRQAMNLPAYSGPAPVRGAGAGRAAADPRCPTRQAALSADERTNRRLWPRPGRRGDTLPRPPVVDRVVRGLVPGHVRLWQDIAPGHRQVALDEDDTSPSSLAARASR